MKTETWLWTREKSWSLESPERLDEPDLVIYHYSSRLPELLQIYQDVKKRFPKSIIVGSSTSGEILQNEMLDDSVVLIAIKFQSTTLKTVVREIRDAGQSREIGMQLGREISKENLKMVTLFSLGHNINGSELVEGVSTFLPPEVFLCGGLAGDGDRFEKTYVTPNSEPSDAHVLLLGFYGDHFVCKNGSFGGWSNFGPKRKIAKSKANVLYELENKPALELYKNYLGDEAENLPGSALLFPLKVFPDNPLIPPVVRTILSIDETERSMTFAGNIPEGYFAQLMTASFESLIDGAQEAARITEAPSDTKAVAILVSCVGRKLVLGQRVVEEIEGVRDILGRDIDMIGYYSYGEVAPSGQLLNCELHDQTMTITLFYEEVQS